jgi:hypothetical protein
MKDKEILNKKEPPFGGSFLFYILGITAPTIAANSVSPFCFFAFRISPKILKLK